MDANQASVVNALRIAGASVQHLHAVGAGCPDILVGHRGRNWLMEIKREGGKRNKKQIEWHDAWRGQVVTVESPFQALRVLKLGENK